MCTNEGVPLRLVDIGVLMNESLVLPVDIFPNLDNSTESNQFRLKRNLIQTYLTFVFPTVCFQISNFTFVSSSSRWALLNQVVS